VAAIQERFPAAEMERAMKIQEVILKAMSGKLKWWEAAEIIGVTDRTMRHWRQQYQQHGYPRLHRHDSRYRRTAARTLR
jgi:transposase-like protein